jgi:ribonuclease HI
MESIEVFTDGSALKNGKADATGGLGVFFGDESPLNYSERLSPGGLKRRVTNNVAELLAIQRAMEIFEKNFDKGKKILHLFTDSEYAFNIFTKWIVGWKRAGWRKKDGKPVENQDIIQAIQGKREEGGVRVIFHHCRSHRSEPNDKTSREYYVWHGNNAADILATQV